MKLKPTRQSRGFGLTEAILLTVIVAVLIVMLLPAYTRPRHRPDPRIRCVSNQKQLGIAFRGFGIDLGATPMRLGETNSVAGEPKP